MQLPKNQLVKYRLETEEWGGWISRMEMGLIIDRTTLFLEMGLMIDRTADHTDYHTCVLHDTSTNNDVSVGHLIDIQQKTINNGAVT